MEAVKVILWIFITAAVCVATLLSGLGFFSEESEFAGISFIILALVQAGTLAKVIIEWLLKSGI